MKHYNPTINKSMADKFNLKGESTTDVYDAIMPCVNVIPKIDVIRNAVIDDATSPGVELYTTPSDKDFYLQSIIMAVIKDANATSVQTFLQVTIEGSLKILAAIPGISLTAQSEVLTLSYPIPIKIDRGTVIQIRNSAAVATIRSRCQITGYTEEVVKNT